MPRNFKSKKAFDKYTAYLHIHDIPHTFHEISIRGKPYKPKRSRTTTKR